MSWRNSTVWLRTRGIGGCDAGQLAHLNQVRKLTGHHLFASGRRKLLCNSFLKFVIETFIGRWILESWNGIINQMNCLDMLRISMVGRLARTIVELLELFATTSLILLENGP